MRAPPSSPWALTPLLAGALALAACGLSDGAMSSDPGGPREEPRDRARGEPPEPDEPTGGVATPDPVPSPPAPSGPSIPVVDLYDPGRIPEIELGFGPEALAVLSNPDPATKETWVHASFKMGDIELADVGVRRKGSFSYRVLPQKASLKVKLNKWVSGQKVHGLTELTLNNMVRSFTFLAERLTFHAFRELGLPAQRANTAHVTINGEDYGIYANVETPGTKFLARVLGDRARTLYEANWGGDWLPARADDFEIDVADPGAPPGTKPDLMALFDAVAAASDQTLLDDVAPHLDIPSWFRFVAAEAVTAQRDGYAYSDAGSHNYFLAGDVDGKFRLVPWSLDTTLSDSFSFVNARVPLNDTLVTRCRRTVACWSAYEVELNAVVDAIEAMDLPALARTWHDQIDPLVRSDPKREISLAMYDERTQQLFAWLAARPDVVRGQLAAP